MTAEVRTRLPLGLGAVDAKTADELIAEILDGKHRGRIIGNLNLHGLYLYRTNEQFKQFCDIAETVLIDGWPILALARGLRRSGLTSAHRFGSTDWLFPLIDEDAPLTVLAVGGTPESAAAASAAVHARTSRMTWLGFDGYEGRFRGSGPSLTLDEALAQADLVLAGMGMPRQEGWVLEHRSAAPHAAFANVGGCLDYIGGVQALAPRWMGRFGIEWAFRLVKDPRRLAGRYLVEPLKLASILAGDVVTRRATRLESLESTRRSSSRAGSK